MKFGEYTDFTVKSICGCRVLSAGNDHPHDPDDLIRCLEFLDQTDAHDRIGMMQDVSPKWSALVNAWNEIVNTFREEMKTGKSATRTYALMKKALGDV